MFKKKDHYKRYDMSWWRTDYWYYYVQWNYFRTPRTAAYRRNELGVRDDLDLREYKFRTRSKDHMPTAWDDERYVGPMKSWKMVSRCRKQWMVNLTK